MRGLPRVTNSALSNLLKECDELFDQHTTLVQYLARDELIARLLGGFNYTNNRDDRIDTTIVYFVSKRTGGHNALAHVLRHIAERYGEDGTNRASRLHEMADHIEWLEQQPK
jgi:hypothetical protein